MVMKFGPYVFNGVLDVGRLIDLVDRDMAAAKAKSRDDVVRFLETVVKRGHTDWLRSHNLKGRALRRAGSPFSEAYDHLEAWLAENPKPKKPRTKRGFVYFIGADENPDVVKIGFATDVDDRRGTLQTASHLSLKLLISFPGTLATESGLHQQFADDHVRGEWFNLSPAIKAFIEQKQRGDP